MKTFGKAAHRAAKTVLDAFRQPDGLPEALAPMFIHRNDQDIPCRQWSWRNQLLVAMARTPDARGYKQWAEVGRQVKKGSKAFHILVPCKKKIEVDGEDVYRLVGFRGMPVFKLEDTEGDALPDDSAEAAEFVRNLPLFEVAEQWGIHVDTANTHQQGALGTYAPFNDVILLGVENLSTWAHEMIHAADYRLTDLAGRKHHQEIVAELGGAILLQCIGHNHDADLGGAYEYIERYAADQKKSVVSACTELLDRTCNAVNLILDTAETAANELVEA